MRPASRRIGPDPIRSSKEWQCNQNSGGQQPPGAVCLSGVLRAAQANGNRPSVAILLNHLRDRSGRLPAAQKQHRQLLRHSRRSDARLLLPVLQGTAELTPAADPSHTERIETKHHNHLVYIYHKMSIPRIIDSYVINRSDGTGIAGRVCWSHAALSAGAYRY